MEIYCSILERTLANLAIRYLGCMSILFRGDSAAVSMHQTVIAPASKMRLNYLVAKE